MHGDYGRKLKAMAKARGNKTAGRDPKIAKAQAAISRKMAGAMHAAGISILEFVYRLVTMHVNPTNQDASILFDTMKAEAVAARISIAGAAQDIAIVITRNTIPAEKLLLSQEQFFAWLTSLRGKTATKYLVLGRNMFHQDTFDYNVVLYATWNDMVKGPLMDGYDQMVKGAGGDYAHDMLPIIGGDGATLRKLSEPYTIGSIADIFPPHLACPDSSDDDMAATQEQPSQASASALLMPSTPTQTSAPVLSTTPAAATPSQVVPSYATTPNSTPTLHMLISPPTQPASQQATGEEYVTRLVMPRTGRLNAIPAAGSLPAAPRANAAAAARDLGSLYDSPGAAAQALSSAQAPKDGTA